MARPAEYLGLINDALRQRSRLVPPVRVRRKDLMRITLIASLVTATLALTSCAARDIDVQSTGAQPVQGASNLYRFCDGPVAIYFTKIQGSADQYDWYWPGGCMWDAKTGRWTFTNTGPAQLPPNGDSTDDGH